MIPRLRSFEALVVAASLVALLGLLRDFTDAFPLIRFLCASVLFLAPGALVARWFAADLFPGAALVPAAFALSAGLFGVLGIPALILHRSLEHYLAACAVVLVASLVVAIVRVVRQKPQNVEKAASVSDPFRWLWVPFIALAGVLAQTSTVARVDGDTWNYLAWVREYLNTRRLAFHDPYFGTPTPEFSRVKINGWILEQAGLSRVTGIDPIPLVIEYLGPALVLVSLLAVYALARLLFESRGAALLTGILYALFFLAYLRASQFSIGGEFLSRAVQDKDVTRFVFLPIALCFAAAFLEKRRLAHLLLFGFLCWSVVSVHPAGLAIIGLSVTGLGLFHVAAHPRTPEAWTRAFALGLALLSVLLLPLLYVLVTGKPLSSALYSADIGASDPAVLANQVFVRESWMRIFVLPDGSYIMHPYLIQNPAIIAAYVLGVPFMIWNLRRSVAARLLLGALFTATVVCYVPPVATFVGDEIVAPGQLYRLSWPILLTAPVVLGWMAWEAIRYVSKKLELRPGASMLLSLALVLALAGAAAPSAVAGIREIHAQRDPQGGTGRLDPMFWWIHRNIKEPSVVLAPDNANTAIPSFSANANVVSFRGQPVLENLRMLERRAGRPIKVRQGSLDVRDFYSGPTVGEAYDILRRNRVDYVMVQAGGALDGQMKRRPGFTRLDVPSERYALFAVDRDELGEP